MEIAYSFVVTTFVSALLAFALGLLWYHPKIGMGDTWLEVRGKDEADKSPTPFPFAVSFMLWLLASAFYSFLAGYHQLDSLPAFFCLSSLLWVAFAMPPTLMGAFYTGYPFQAVAIDSAYQLAGYYVFAAVHAAAGLVFV